MEKNRTKRLVLGEGETIGHKHVLQSKKDIDYEKNIRGITILLSGTGVLTHDEHDRIVLEPGQYRSYHQVEFNPMDGSIDWVTD